MAEDLGVYGPSWEIAEPDAIDATKNKIRRMQKDGSLKKKQDEYVKRSIEGIKNPPPVPGITTSAKYQVRVFDPTYTFPEALKDETGKVLIPAGTRLNPLDYQPLGKRLLFIDGRDTKQVEMARLVSKAHPEDKIILTGGSFIETSRSFGKRVYFDQRGVLTRHFEVSTVPTLITQTGRLLTIESGYKHE
jgi:conjugal transfer pilus assembly protein TraW